MTIHIDIIDGSTGRYTSEGWQDVTRIATVTGLTGSGQGKLFAAVTELVADVRCGPITAVHPENSDVQLVEIVPTATGPTSATCTLRYGRHGSTDPSAATDQAVIRFGSRVRQVETNIDANGDVVFVEYTYPTNPADKNYPHHNTRLANGKAIARSPTFSVYKPESVFTVTRREATIPRAKAQLYVGTVNNAGGALGPASFGTELCTAIEAVGPRSGPFDVGYEFQTNDSGWNGDEVVFEREDGVIPSDIGGDARKTVTKYLTEDFANLHLI